MASATAVVSMTQRAIDLEERRDYAMVLYSSFLLFCEKDLGAKYHLLQLLDDYVNNSNYESKNCALNLVLNEIKKK